MHARRTLLATALALSSLMVTHSFAEADAAPTGFRALPAPARIADTRAEGVTVDGVAQATGLVTGGRALELQVGGRAGVNPQAAAITANVTAVGATGPGFLTVYPCDQARPLTSNVNYLANSVNSNGVFAALDGAGKVCVFSRADVHVVVDVNGWLPDGVFDPLAAPARLADTRPAPDGVTFDGVNSATGVVASRQELALQVGGRAGIAADASAVVLNVTVTQPDAAGYVTVYPCGAERPLASNLNYTALETTANAVVTSLAADGRVCLFTLANTHLIVDVAGALDGTQYIGLDAPARLVDSRATGATIDGQIQGDGFRRAGTTLQIPVTDRADIPPEATAVALNVTAVGAANPGFLTLHPRNSARPKASNVNYVPGDVVANSVISAIGGDGMVCVFASADVDVVVDVAGYFVGEPPTDTGERCPLEFPIRSMWDGYPVGPNQLPAGRYVSETPAASKVWCEIKRLESKDFDYTGNNSQYGYHVAADGRLIADVRATDGFLDYATIIGTDTVGRCLPLVPYEAPAPPPLATTFGAGDHEVGVHVAPGTYSSGRVPDMGRCVVLVLSSFDGSAASRLARYESDDADNITITVPASAEGISVSNTCLPFS